MYKRQALGCIALVHYDNVSLGILTGERSQHIPPLRGKNELGRFLHLLETLQPQGSIDLAAAVQSYCGAPRRGVGVLISDLLTPTGTAEAIGYLRRAGLAPVVLHLLAREEQTPTLEGPFDLVDCETGAVLSTAINGEALRAYGERFTAWTNEVEAHCEAQRATYVRLTSDQPMEEMIFASLRTRAVLR